MPSERQKRNNSSSSARLLTRHAPRKKLARPSCLTMPETSRARGCSSDSPEPSAWHGALPHCSPPAALLLLAGCCCSGSLVVVTARGIRTDTGPPPCIRGKGKCGGSSDASRDFRFSVGGIGAIGVGFCLVPGRRCVRFGTP